MKPALFTARKPPGGQRLERLVHGPKQALEALRPRFRRHQPEAVARVVEEVGVHSRELRALEMPSSHPFIGEQGMGTGDTYRAPQNLRALQPAQEARRDPGNAAEAHRTVHGRHVAECLVERGDALPDRRAPGLEAIHRPLRLVAARAEAFPAAAGFPVEIIPAANPLPRHRAGEALLALGRSGLEDFVDLLGVDHLADLIAIEFTKPGQLSLFPPGETRKGIIGAIGARV
jgi:hypothetical protein